jgi:carbamate kinase
VRALAPLAAAHDLVITHGNGPQGGMLALENAHDPAIARPYPFDVLGAQTQGMIGYWLVQALQNALPGRSAGPHPTSCGSDFPAGSMGPKIGAVCRFTEVTGKPAAIGAAR